MLLNHLLLGLFGLWAIYFFLVKLILFKLILNIILPLIIRYLLIPALPDCVRPYAERALEKCDEHCYAIPLEPKGPSNRDVYRTAMILTRVTDRDVVAEILDLAELWHDVHLVSRIDPEPVNVNDREHSRNSHKPGLIYVEAELPDTLPPKALRSITFSTSSRDQGHTTEMQDVGTYRNSKTWFEVEIYPPGQSVRSADEEDMSSSEDEEEPPPKPPRKSQVEGELVFDFPPRKIITNIHAGQEFKTHTVTWHYDDEDPDIRRLIRTMGAGWKVAISVWAQAHTWENYIRSARIDCRVHTVRKL
ncbi:hypothetical protein AYO21_03031 [Fonsecaea monophora]|uniref:Uncharacterized protein n=1 Tax=Fonsecaea monophora TaxID=254056 RepID=A0A177FEY8_9EURO|nr:hypothetical protein AYO21_03031 [Fonsecaea monophora]OAG42748.1 hypothetical protein AYO21_03031 [Fonsecaea monophora]